MDDGDLARLTLQIEHARSLLWIAACLILGLACLSICLWRRLDCSSALLVAEVRRHCDERCSMLKQQSHELVSLQMRMLHAFEMKALPTPPASASSPVSFDETKPPPT